ncbi:MAG: c-type cytochrome [Deltaproteobacteria bacterium]|nr:c-type cytochrome [Deltaproteobacteria bacterium]MBI3386922.1 c-type cytochrome [Deltaproteobacteria bacterium]
MRVRFGTLPTLMWIAIVVFAAPLRADDQVATLKGEGATIYTRYCVGCHGVNGDGNSAAAPMLLVKPRDFTKGIFKFRSTPSGTLPTDEDLYRIVSRGVYRTSMPDWSLLSERERLAVVEYIKGFFPEWKTRGAGTPIYVPPPPAALGSPASVARGRELYTMLECTACHGESGRGDGLSAKNLPPDSWGNAQKPFDFTKGRLKSGPTPQDVYRTFMTGVGGTAMPSFADIFAEPDGENILAGDAWNLVSYILSLRATDHSPVAEAGKEASR